MNVLFFFGGTLYWWPMVGIDPILHWKMGYGARMLNILLASGIEAFLGVAILADSHPAASMYSLASTHSGGALLWTSTEFVEYARKIVDVVDIPLITDTEAVQREASALSTSGKNRFRPTCSFYRVQRGNAATPCSLPAPLGTFALTAKG